MRFVGLLTSPDNTDGYTYLGFLKGDFPGWLNAGRKGNPDATPFKALHWALSEDGQGQHARGAGVLARRPVRPVRAGPDGSRLHRAGPRARVRGEGLMKVPLALRDQYPQMAGLFDRFDDMTKEVEEAVSRDDYHDVEQHRDKLAANMDEMAARCAQMCEMVTTLLKMDAAEPLKAELQQLANKADDAFWYAEQNK
jgi:hypothetical protein